MGYYVSLFISDQIWHFRPNGAGWACFSVAPNVKRGISNLHGRLRAHNVKWHKGPQSRREMSADKSYQGYITTVSAPLKPRGSIFQNGFLGRVQFKFGYNLTNFWAKIKFLTGVVLEFSGGGVLFKSEAQMTSIGYFEYNVNQFKNHIKKIKAYWTNLF